ncbi:hypothetical protein GGF46_001181 [Coemansia sp. RSA 552]|nr:hypothetical protein GGF46_001181 [Coemansia sp. RSA 552]
MATDVRHDPEIMQAVKAFQPRMLAAHPELKSSTIWLDIATDHHIRKEADIIPLFEREVVSRVVEIAAKTHPLVTIEWVEGNPTGHADGFFILRSPGGGRDGNARSTMVAVEHKQPFADATSKCNGKGKGKSKGKGKGAKVRVAAVTEQVGLHTSRALVKGIVGQLAQYLAMPKAIRMPTKLQSHPRYHMGVMTDINHTWLVSCPDASRWRTQGKEGPQGMARAVFVATLENEQAKKGKALNLVDQYLGSIEVSGCIKPVDTDPPLVFAIAFIIAQAAGSLLYS